MFKKTLPFFLIAETPLHPGSGSELGTVDLPIQREKHTNFPKIEASGLKGCLREAFEARETLHLNGAELKGSALEAAINVAFGPEEGDAHAGSLGFTDARLLLFPVKSMKGVFAWITCPQVLMKFQQELNLPASIMSPFPAISAANTCPQGCSVTIHPDKVVLEEYTFSLKPEAACTSLASWLADRIFPQSAARGDPASRAGPQGFWRDKLKKDLIVLPDDDFRDFVTFSTEVVARTKIDNDKGTVQPRALFYEEYLPEQSVLYSLALAGNIFAPPENKGAFTQQGKCEEDMLLAFFKSGLPPVLQIGGNATIGKGIVRVQTQEVAHAGE